MKAIALSLLGLIALAALPPAGQCAAPASQPASEPAPKFQNVNAERFAELAREKNAVILDVRTPREYRAGHIPGAINIDVLNEEKFDREVAKLDKSKTYLVHCALGGRSHAACEKLDAIDFPHLYNLEGGFKAWKKAGQPVTTEPTTQPAS